MKREVDFGTLIVGALIGAVIILLIFRPWEGPGKEVQAQLDLIQEQRDRLATERDSLKDVIVETDGRIAYRDSIILVYKQRRNAGKNYLRNTDRGGLASFFSTLDTTGVFGSGR